MASTYQYTEAGPNKIRLMRLLDSGSSKLCIEISTFTWREAPVYTALSYRWGDPTRNIDVVAGNCNLRITESLNVFLREATTRKDCTDDGSRWASGWLWIDAICINQDDNNDRSQQVKKMKEIYEHAEGTVIWLGEAEQGTSDAFDLMEEIAALETEEPLHMTTGVMPGHSCRLGNDEAGIEILLETLTYDLGNLLRSSYWDRAWIIQEASTPNPSSKGTQNLLVCCGEHTIGWEIFSEANRRLLEASWHNDIAELAPLHGVANGDIATVQYIQDRRRTFTYEEPMYPMLVRTRTAIATDPRDKIFAVLGLVKERQHPDLQPDYNLSVEEVYTRAAKALIESTHSLDLLGSAHLHRDHKVPSWVTDWTVGYHVVPQPFYQYDQYFNRDGNVASRQNLFNASRGMDIKIEFEKNDQRLVGHGFIFDKVTEVSKMRAWLSRDVTPQVLWQNWTDMACPDTSVYVSGCSRAGAFKRVLRADFAECFGDWSAERGSAAGDPSPRLDNQFEEQDPSIDAMTYNRSLFLAGGGYMGLGPGTIATGDRLCIVGGSQMPLILRAADQDRWLSYQPANI